MPSNDKDIGYNTKAIEDLAAVIEKHMVREERDRQAIHARLVNIEKDISLARFIAQVIKAVFWTGVFIATIRFGDIKTLWASIHLS